MISLFRAILVIGCAMSSLAAAEPIRPKVVVVAIFEAGADIGDRPPRTQRLIRALHLPISSPERGRSFGPPPAPPP